VLISLGEVGVRIFEIVNTNSKMQVEHAPSPQRGMDNRPSPGCGFDIFSVFLFKSTQQTKKAMFVPLFGFSKWKILEAKDAECFSSISPT
jgi:hypothetical protein